MKQGRPTKLNERVIQAFKKVLADPLNVKVCTDAELFFLLNCELEEEEQLSYRTFQRYKSRAMLEGKADAPVDPIYRTLYQLLMQAIIQQKKNLYTKIEEAKQGWQRFRWLFERKFGTATELWRGITAQEPDEVTEAHKRYYFEKLNQLKEQGFLTWGAVGEGT